MSSENSDGKERQAKGDEPAWTLSRAAQLLKVSAIAQLFSDKSAVPVEAGEGGAELGDTGEGGRPATAVLKHLTTSLRGTAHQAGRHKFRD